MIKDVVKSYEQAKQILMNTVTAQLNEEFKTIFSRYPEVNSFSWPQYTPYFNDGDECIFRVCADQWSIKVNEDTCDDNAAVAEISQAISEILGPIPNEIMQSVYGDHVMVTINRAGESSVEDYEHD